MKNMLISGFFIVLFANSYSQNLDLVVTTSGDSIACKIDSVSAAEVFIQIKTPGSDTWIQTMYDKASVIQFKYNCINPSEFDFLTGSTKITGKAKPVYSKKFPNKMTLNNATTADLDYYYAKAKHKKKKGAVMSIVGPLAATAGGLLAAASFSLSGDDGGFVFGSLLLFAGIGTTLVGLPVLITGSHRVNTINDIKKSRGLTMEFIPGGYYNHQAQNYQPGATLRIRF